MPVCDANNIKTWRGVMMLKLLSPDEIIVLRFLAEGYSNSQISDRLFVPVSKVKQDVNAILNKLGLKNRIQAAGTAALFINSTKLSGKDSRPAEP